jgi:hypothetical protein
MGSTLTGGRKRRQHYKSHSVEKGESKHGMANYNIPCQEERGLLSLVRRQTIFAKEFHMQYGFILPHGDVHTLAELAHEAEMVGWDGVFYWDGI